MKRMLIYLMPSVVVFIAALLFFEKIFGDYAEELFDNPYHIQGLSMLDEIGECITSEPIKVFQVITENSALARVPSYAEFNFNSQKIVLILNDNGQTYFDGQFIQPKSCFRQIGTYRYEENKGVWETLPAVKSL